LDVFQVFLQETGHNRIHQHSSGWYCPLSFNVHAVLSSEAIQRSLASWAANLDLYHFIPHDNEQNIVQPGITADIRGIWPVIFLLYISFGLLSANFYLRAALAVANQLPTFPTSVCCKNVDLCNSDFCFAPIVVATAPRRRTRTRA
jgi:hypothetical protein